MSLGEFGSYSGPAIDRERDLLDEIARLRAAGYVAFMAMCDQRDNPDVELFQDAIDAFGCALTEKE